MYILWHTRDKKTTPLPSELSDNNADFLTGAEFSPIRKPPGEAQVCIDKDRMFGSSKNNENTTFVAGSRTPSNYYRRGTAEFKELEERYLLYKVNKLQIS